MIRFRFPYRVAVPVVLLLGAAPALAAQGVPMPHAPLSTVLNALSTVRSNYEEHYNMGHASAVAALYAEDAIAIGLDGKVMMGRDAIEKGLADQIKQGGKLSIKPDTTNVMGNTAVEIGTATVSGGSGGDMTMRYLVVLRESPSGWHLFRVADTPAGGKSGM